MCAMSLLNGVPSCGSHLLLTTMLRDSWKSDAIIQSDCCDSVNTMKGEINPHSGPSSRNPARCSLRRALLTP